MAEFTTPNKHIVPAFINWMFENDPRIHITCNADYPGFSMMPPLHPDSKAFTKCENVNYPGMLPITFKFIVLNISIEAVTDYHCDEEGISFKCRMSGQVTHVFVPHNCVLKISAPDSQITQDLPVDFSYLENTTEQEQVSSPVVTSTEQATGNDAPVRKNHLTVIK